MATLGTVAGLVITVWPGHPGVRASRYDNSSQPHKCRRAVPFCHPILLPQFGATLLVACHWAAAFNRILHKRHRSHVEDGDDMDLRNCHWSGVAMLVHLPRFDVDWRGIELVLVADAVVHSTMC